MVDLKKNQNNVFGGVQFGANNIETENTSYFDGNLGNTYGNFGTSHAENLYGNNGTTNTGNLYGNNGTTNAGNLYGNNGTTNAGNIYGSYGTSNAENVYGNNWASNVGNTYGNNSASNIGNVYGSFKTPNLGTNNGTIDNSINFQPIAKDKAIVKQGAWAKIKAFLFQEVNLNAPIKIQLTPYQQKVEDEVNEFLHQEITFKGIANLFKGKK